MTSSPEASGTAATPASGPTDAISERLGLLANLGWQILLTMGLAAIALGVVFLVWPGETLRVVGVLFGIYLLLIGVFQLAAAFGTHIPGYLRALHFLGGALCLLLGLICFRGSLESILLLALWIGFGWLLRGIMVTATAASAEAMPARGWMLFSGVIGMLAGMALIVAPFASIAALTLTVGVVAIVLGAVEVFHAIRVRIEVGHVATSAAGRPPSFRSQPHPQH
ncbi:DUF308 domain-containing protein [Streptomyces sp. NPDC002766]|uniref:HdeD family acid-resistance protein n=1 Tax=unclassified Streptomyces TaxID=2593676 RepID=UPI003332D391